MKVTFKDRAAEAIERANMVEAQRQQDYVALARFFAEAAATDSRFEYEAQLYANLAEQAAEMAEYSRLADAGMTDAEIQKAMGK